MKAPVRAQIRHVEVSATVGMILIAPRFSFRCAAAYRRGSDRTRRLFNAAVLDDLRVRDGHVVEAADSRPPKLRQFRLTLPRRQSRLTAMDVEDLNLHLSSADPAVGLRASLALHRLAERVEAHHVAAAREKGWSWQQIGDALGITRQSVHTKYSKESS
jgi:hypothetical protein